jgi:hypothetical protein
VKYNSGSSMEFNEKERGREMWWKVYKMWKLKITKKY